MQNMFKSQDLNREIKSAHSLLIENLSLPERKLLDTLLWHANHFREIWSSQSTFAKYADVSREWCNKLLHRLQELGLITIKNRGIKKTCLYRVAKWFGDPQIRFQLARFLPALRAASLLLFTQYIYEYKYTKTTSSNITTKRERNTSFSTTSNYTKFEEVINFTQKGVKEIIMNKKFIKTVWERSPFDQKEEDFIYSQPTRIIIQPVIKQQPIVQAPKPRGELTREEILEIRERKLRQAYPRGIPLHLRMFKG